MVPLYIPLTKYESLVASHSLQNLMLSVFLTFPFSGCVKISHRVLIGIFLIITDVELLCHVLIGHLCIFCPFFLPFFLLVIKL